MSSTNQRTKRTTKRKLKPEIKIILILIVLALISAVVFVIFKNFKVEKSNVPSSVYQYSEEKIKNIEVIKKEVAEREKAIKEINEGKRKAEEYELLSAEKFYKYLESKNLLSLAEKDQVIGNTIYTANATIDVNDYVIENGKAVKSSNGNSVDSDEPQIFPTDKLVMEDDKVIVKLSENGKVNFDKFKYNGEYIFEVLDKRESNLTEAVEATYSAPVDTWVVGKEYKVNYKVTNNRGKTATKEITVLVKK